MDWLRSTWVFYIVPTWWTVDSCLSSWEGRCESEPPRTSTCEWQIYVGPIERLYIGWQNWPMMSYSSRPREARVSLFYNMHCIFGVTHPTSHIPMQVNNESTHPYIMRHCKCGHFRSPIHSIHVDSLYIAPCIRAVGQGPLLFAVSWPNCLETSTGQRRLQGQLNTVLFTMNVQNLHGNWSSLRFWFRRLCDLKNRAWETATDNIVHRYTYVLLFAPVSGPEYNSLITYNSLIRAGL